MKRFKNILCLVLGLCLLTGGMACAEPGQENPGRSLTISSVEELLQFAEDCRLDSYSWGLEVKLISDIDMKGQSFEGAPIFCGSFDGQGYTISGLRLEQTGSVQGFFRHVSQNAQVKNLNLKGDFAPGGSRSSVGALVGSNSGTITNCSFDGSINGADKVGGLVGENNVTGIIEKCSVSGEITGSHFVGGIAGNNLGVIRQCINNAHINTTPSQNMVELSEITIDTLTGTEAVNTSTDVGGIVGASQGFVHDCVNHGPVGYKQMGYNIGGIAGTQMGYIANCHNYGDVCGRKEVGGIVGQMEPSNFIAFEQDAVQILQEQLAGLASTVGQAGASIQNTSNAVRGHTNVLMAQIGETGQALDALRQQGGLDPDTFYAAQNVLSSGMANMGMTMQGMAASTMSAVGAISNNIYALQSQINAMQSTLGNITETVGGSIRDMSDKDTPDQLTGKVEGCSNAGLVSGDMNVGGIAGAMALENDLDVMEDYTLGEGNSLNFISELRAVILSCRNSGQVNVNHNAGGGIVGFMQFGLVNLSSSACRIDAASADYVGGIAGRSESYVRGCSAKAEITGDSYVGGIAGQGDTVSECRSMVRLHGSEKLGSVLGYGVLENNDEGSPKIFNNYYLSDKEDKGGIDGVSYAGVAHSLDNGAFMSLSGLSDVFKKVQLSFVQEDGSILEVTIDSGSRIDPALIPEPLKKPGYLSHWEGLEDVEYDYDASFHASYTAISSTIASTLTTEGGLPLLLAEGSFMPGSNLSVYQANGQPAIAENEKLIVALSYKASDGGSAQTLRFHVGQQSQDMKAYVGVQGAQWQESPATLVGSYLVVELPEGTDSLAVVSVGTQRWQYAAAAGGVALLCLTILVLMRRRALKRKKKLTVQP